MESEKKTSLEKSLSNKRFILSIIILGIASILLIITLYCIEDYSWETAFTAIVGLVGTWVGAVIAFYFSKENFDAASESTQKLVDSITTSKDKLNAVKASSAMILMSQITMLTLMKGKKMEEYKLTEILTKYLSSKNRLPIINEDGTIFGIMHKSLLVEFITNQAINGSKPADLSLAKLLDDKNSKAQVLKGFSTVKESDSLMSTKMIMEKLSVDGIICSDVFVTSDGSKNSKVIGWITNVEIAKHSIV